MEISTYRVKTSGEIQALINKSQRVHLCLVQMAGVNLPRSPWQHCWVTLHQKGEPVLEINDHGTKWHLK